MEILACLSTCLSTCQSTCLPTSLPTCLYTHLPPTFLPVYPSTHSCRQSYILYTVNIKIISPYCQYAQPPAFHQRVSSIEGCLPSKIVFHQRLSSIKGHLPSKVVFHPRLSSIKGQNLSVALLSWAHEDNNDGPLNGDGTFSAPCLFLADHYTTLPSNQPPTSIEFCFDLTPMVVNGY